MADIRTTPLPQVGGNKGPVMDRAVARRHDYGFQAPAVNSSSAELEGLVRGLSTFNSALGQYTDQQIRNERAALTELAQNEAAARAAKTDLSQVGVEDAVAQDLPANVPLAYGGIFREALGSMLVDRAAITAKQDWANAYREESQKEDFDPERFIQGFREKALSGLKDPALVGRMGKHLSEMEGALRTQAEKDRIAKLEAQIDSGLFSAFQEHFRADMTPEQVFQEYQKHLPAWRGLGRTSKELAQTLLGRLQYLSNAKNGDPSVFDVFDMVTDNGQTLLAANPELADNVMAAREQARGQNRRHLEEQSQKANVPVMDALNRQLETNPNSITLDLVMQHVGPHSVFPTTEAAANFLARARAKAAEGSLTMELMQAFDTGILGRYKPEDQKKVLEAKLGPVITQSWQEAVNGNPQAASALATAIMSAQNSSRSTVPVEAIERLVQSTITTQPNPDGPNGAFQAVAALYTAFSADPKFREMYFKDDVAEIMKAYTKAVQAGDDPQAAYTTAYNAISPEAKAAAEKFTKSQEFKDKVTKATKEVVGSSFWPRWLGGSGRITNQVQVESDAQSAVRDYLARRPFATEDEVNDYVGSWVSRNYVMDENTGAAIKVPPQFADDTTKQAISEYAKRVAEVYRLSDRNDGEWKVHFRPVGDQGLLQVVMADGMSETQLGVLSVGSLRDAFVAEKSFSEPEVAGLRQLQQMVSSGTVDVDFLQANSGLLHKAKKLNGLPASSIQKLEKLQYDTVKQRLDSIPKMSFGTPSLDNLQHVPQRAVKVDNKLTAQVARQLATMPVAGAKAAHTSLAASLITMGEAVVLKAYPDPAKDAGMNIGMGYNLKANAKTAKEDLKRAGVDADKVQAVIDGTAQLTPQQAQRLLMVTLPRYEKLAKDAADGTAPGLWDRMTPHQKAVMVDIAWQTGSPEKFRRAWASLANGNMEGFREETKVFYTDRSGNRKEDKRRNDLRAAMLNGSSQWLAVVDKYDNFPSNAMEAFALNQPNQQ